ncbi:MAG: hypothetical protein ACOYL3_10550 [Desulfuromonadaceae bacterium]
MPAITFDTLEFVERLEKTGVSGELLLVQWMLGVIIAISVANFAKQFF